MELDPNKEIKDVTFDFQGAHLALCHESQGFSANNKPMPLLVKGDEEVTEEALQDLEKIMGDQGEVQITTSMFDFLRKWYNLYWDDANTLSRILGFSGDGFDAEFVDESVGNVKLLKCKDIKELNLEKASQEDLRDLVKFMESGKIDFDKNSFSEGNSEVKQEINESQKPSEDKLNKNQGVLMSKDVEKLDKTADIEALQARLAEVEKKASEDKERAEALASKVAEFEKAQAARVQAAFEAKTEEYSFVTPEEKAEFAKTLIKLDSVDGEIAEAMVSVLDKAQAAVNAIDGAQGSDDAEGVSITKSSSLEEKLLAKYGDKK